MKSLHSLITRFLLLCCLTMVAACGPLAFPSAPTPETTTNISQTNKGITVTVTDIQNSLFSTTLTILIQADSQWDVRVDSDPPAVAMLSNPLLFDETGKQFTPFESTHGLAQLDESTGGIKFENTITFELATGAPLTFQSEIEIEGIPVSPTVEISLTDHQVLDDWPISQSLSFSDFTDLTGNVRLLSRDDTKLVLEFTFERISNDGLELACLHFWPDTNLIPIDYCDCTGNDNQVISKLKMDISPDETLPLFIRVTGTIIITEPFTVSVPSQGQ